MTRLEEICVFIVVIGLSYDVYSTPIFEGINIEKKINIEFKPFKFKPITFITEKWGPFGKIIGKKHTIERRDLEETNIIDKDEEIEPIAKNPAERMIPVQEEAEDTPRVVQPFLSPVKAIMPASSATSSTGLNTNILSSIPGNPLFKPNAEIATPVVEVKPIEGPLFVPIRDGPETPPLLPPSPPPPSSPSPPPPPPPDSKPPPRSIGILSFFREFFTELVTQLIARARSSLSQLGSPPVQQ